MPAGDTSTSTSASAGSSATYCMDIGYLLKQGSLYQLSGDHKLKLIDHTPEEKFNYPTTS